MLLVQIAWMAYAVLSKFGIQITDGIGQPLTFWLLWEIASIAVTLAVTIGFWVSCFMREGGHSIFEGSGVRYGATGALLLLVFGFGFGMAGWCAWTKKSLTLQMFMLAVGVIGTIGLQLLAMASTFNALKARASILSERRSKEQKKMFAEQVRTIIGNRDNVAKFLCFSDLPIAFAILVLALMVTVHDSIGVLFDENQMRSFVAGAVAIQLLYSNFVFWLEALADYPPGHKVLGLLPEWLKPIRQMLHPAGHLPSDASSKWAGAVLQEFLRSNTLSPGEQSSTSSGDVSPTPNPSLPKAS